MKYKRVLSIMLAVMMIFSSLFTNFVWAQEPASEGGTFLVEVFNRAYDGGDYQP